MRPRPLLIRFARDASGVTAIEFAFILPTLMLMILGGIWLGLLSFSKSGMDLAVQGAARCMSVDANNCGTTSATQTYAQSLYGGPKIAPVFTASTTGCGHTVTAQATFSFNFMPGLPDVPLSASACYP
jgi:Flp pilus assembly protein TadG